MSPLSSKTTFTQDSVEDLRGRTALVTGGTGGIGYEVARALALANARVLVLSRKVDNGHAAVEKMKESAPEGIIPDVEFVECDLGSLEKVREVGQMLCEREERLDLFIGDAGVGVNKFDFDSDGLDRHFGVNVLGHYYLLNLLLPLMRRTAAIPNTPSPRIVLVSSSLHSTAPSSVKFKDASEVKGNEKPDAGFGPEKLYARSKLGDLLLVKALDDYVLKSDLGEGAGKIWVEAIHPGAVHTAQPNQFKEAYGKVFGTLAKAAVIPFMTGPDEGSLSTLYAATSDDIPKNGWQAEYFTQPGPPGGESKQAQDKELQKNLWELCESLVKEKLGEGSLRSWAEVQG